MSDLQQLTLSYLESHPKDAAKVLADLPSRNAAALLTALPVRLCTPIVRAMPPYKAALTLKYFPEERSAPLITSLSAQEGATILRHLDKKLINRLFKSLPTHTALRFRLLLRYPEDSVGAHMSPLELTIQRSETVGKALQLVREHEDFYDSVIFVVDSDQKLQGIVSTTELIKRNQDTPIDNIMKRDFIKVSARASAVTLLDHSAWEQSHTLPVVEYDNRAVGTLSRSSLTRAQTAYSTAQSAKSDTISEIANTYWVGLSGIVHALAKPLMQINRSEQDKKYGS
jgi:magnesium transporter